MSRRTGNPRVTIGADEHVSRATRDAEDGLQRLARSGASSLRGLGTALTDAGKVAALAIGGGLVLEFKRATEAFEESAKVAKQTNAVITSTGGAAKVTAADVERLASALSRKAGVDDEVIQSGQNVLLTFKEIRNETGEGNKVFDRATRTTLDLSVALKKDMASSAILVGKALNDPVRGATALSRAGVQLTETQREQIETFVESNRTLQAQKIILRELESQFGGSATAQARSLDKTKVAVGNVEEAIGRGLSPAVSAVADEITELATRAEPELTGLAEQIEGVFGRRDLQISEKFRISAQEAQRTLGPFVRGAEAELDRLDVGERLSGAVNRATPVVADAAAKVAVEAGKRFAGAFIASDPMTRLLLGGWLLSRAGGFAAWKTFGRRAGAEMAAGAALGAGAAGAAGAAAGAGAGRAGRGRGATGGGGIGTRGAIAAGLVATMNPAAIAAAGAIVAGPEVAKGLAAPFARDSEANNVKARGIYLEGKIDEARRRGAGSIIEYTRALKDMIAEERRGADDLEGFRDEHRKFGRQLSEAAQPTQLFVDQMDRMRESTDQSLSSIRTNVRITTRGIKRHFGEDTADGKELLVANFAAAAQAVKNRMDAAGRHTKAGLREMRGYMRQALQELGLSPEQARNISRGGGDGRQYGDPDANRGREGGAPIARAGGGWIGQAGEAGADDVPVMVGRGEAVLNRHQQAVVEGLLGDGFLDQLFESVQRPHYMARGGRPAQPRFAAARLARGGIVPVPGFPGERASSTILDEISSLTRRFPGLRLTDAFGPGHQSPGHTVHGTAADFAGPDEVMDAAVRTLVAAGYLVGYDGRFGSQAWPGHGPTAAAGQNAHLHVEFGTQGGQLRAAAPRLRRARFPGGMGTLSAVGQRQLDVVHRAGRRMLRRSMSASLQAPVAGGGDGGGGAWSKRQLMQLYRRVGLPNPGLMAAIALAESSGIPDAFGPPSGRGHLQIEWNVWAERMRRAGLSNPNDPWQNAQMAKIVLAEQGLDAWVAYTTGRHRQFLGRGGIAGTARAARGRPGRRFSLGRPNPPRRGMAWTAPTSPFAYSPPAAAPPPGAGGAAGYEQGLADAGVSRARAERDDSLPALVTALRAERQIKRRRLKKVRRALKRRKRMQPATRTRLTNEQAQLIADIADLSDLLAEYGAALGAGESTISGATDGGDDEIVDAPTARDYADAALAQAELTPGLDDDLAALQGMEGAAAAEYQAALASGDPRRIAAAAGDLKGVRDAITALNETITGANRLAEQRLDLDRQLVENQGRLIALAEQGDKATAAIVAAVSGAIGGRVGLGFQSVGVAGQLART